MITDDFSLSNTTLFPFARACKILDHKHQLSNYSEQCRKYILNLDLEDEVCGKCIKACLKDGIYADQFKL